MDVLMPVKRGDLELKVRLRTVATPEEELAGLVSALGLRLPTRSNEAQNMLEKKGLKMTQDI